MHYRLFINNTLFVMPLLSFILGNAVIAFGNHPVFAECLNSEVFWESPILLFEKTGMQKRFQQLAGVALDTLGLSKIDDPALIEYLSVLDSIEISFRYFKPI